MIGEGGVGPTRLGVAQQEQGPHADPCCLTGGAAPPAGAIRSSECLAVRSRSPTTCECALARTEQRHRIAGESGIESTRTARRSLWFLACWSSGGAAPDPGRRGAHGPCRCTGSIGVLQSWSVSSSPGGEQMRTNPDEFGDTLERSARVEHDAAIDGVLHSLVDVGEQHGCALDGDEIDEASPATCISPASWRGRCV